MPSFAQQYNTLCLVDSCIPSAPANENPALKDIWELDSAIRAEFSGTIQMYEQGLIHSMELMLALNQIIHRQRP